MWFANVHRDTKHKPQPYTAEDFMPNPYAPPKAVRMAEQAGIMASYAEHAKRRHALGLTRAAKEAKKRREAKRG